MTQLSVLHLLFRIIQFSHLRSTPCIQMTSNSPHFNQLLYISCFSVAIFSDPCSWWKPIVTTDREQENGGLDDGSTQDDENGEENDTDSGKNNVDNGHDESAIRRYQGSRSNSKTVVSMQRTSARVTARTLLPPADGSRTPSSTARVPKPSRNGT